MGVFMYRRPLPAFATTATEQRYTQKEANISWPEQGQAAIGAVGYGVLGNSSNNKVAPTASVAKVITALAVLERKPLSLDEQGPSITFTDADVEIYNKYVALGGSVVPVSVGGTLTEYQALQALLLPSANNIAESLANWAFGSQAGYVAFANTFAADMQMKDTTVDDASGFSPKTTSTASDLVKLGLQALDHPVVAAIVQQNTAELPGVGTIYSTNKLLGGDGIIGIKTGNTDEAGGCYLVASRAEYEGGYKVTVVAAVMGTPTLIDAMNASKPLLTQAKQNFGSTVVVTAGQQFGRLRSAWGEQTAVTAKNDVTLFGWQDGVPITKTTFKTTSFSKGSIAGTAQITFGEQQAAVDLVQDSDIRQPGLWWRIFRR